MARKKVWSIVLITAIVWFAIFIPLARPIGLPLYVTPLTREFHKYLKSLSPGDIILHNANTYSGSIRGTTLLIKYCIKNKIKWVGWSDYPLNAAWTMECLKHAGAFEAKDWVYGEDWVWLGYIPGAEAAHAAIRDDFQSIAVADYRGTPASELPLLQKIHSEKDVDMFVGSGETHLIWSRLWPTKPERPTLVIIPTDIYPATLPYHPRVFAAILNGIGGAAELEFATGMPGRAIAATDALSASTIAIMIAAIIAQFEVIADKLRVKKLEEK